MTYQPIRGDIGLVSTSGIVGFFIQLGTFSKLNHAFIYEGNGVIIEATPKLGVKRSPVNAYTDIVWSQHKSWTDEERDIIVKEAQSMLGCKYFFADIVVIACRILRLPVPKFFINRLGHAKSVICSQEATRCWRKAGYNMIPEKPAYFVTPSDIGMLFLYL